MTIIKFDSFEEFKESIDEMNPFEFEQLVFNLFLQTDAYSGVQHNQVINGRQVDIGLIEKSKNHTFKRSYWAVEVKSYKSKIPVNVIDAFYSKLMDLSEIEPDSNLLVVSINGFTRAAVEVAKRRGVQLWGVRDLYSLYVNNEANFTASPSQDSEYDGAIESKVNAFLKMLKEIEPGTSGWSKYQQLVFEIIEFLLCPPLENPTYELADRDKRNRRDFIFENSASDGFWKIVRET